MGSATGGVLDIESIEMSFLRDKVVLDTLDIFDHASPSGCYRSETVNTS